MRFHAAIASAALGFLALGADAKKCTIKNPSLTSAQSASTTSTIASSSLNPSASTSQSSIISTTETSQASSSSNTSVSTSTTPLASSTLSSSTTSSESSTINSSSTTSSESTTSSSSTSSSSLAVSTPTSTSSTSATSSTTSTIPVTTTTSTTSTSTTSSSASTTTTTVSLPRPRNLGFDDSSTNIDPWVVVSGDASAISVDSSRAQAGGNSLKITATSGASYRVQQSLDASKIQAGVSYNLAAYFYKDGTNPCAGPSLACGFDGTVWDSDNTGFEPGDSGNQFHSRDLTCSFQQSQIDAGNLWISVGMFCGPGSTGWIDTVSFGQPPV